MKRPILSIATLLLCISLAEWWAGGQDLGRVQHVQASSEVEFRVLDGVPVWASRAGGDRLNASCRPSPGGATVVLMGDSIFYGVQLEAQQTLGPKVQGLLPGPPGCVYNLAQPAFAMENQLAVARERFEALAPDLVIWEIWENSPSHFAVVGDGAWNFGQIRTGEDGLPSIPGLSPGLSRVLFQHSGLYRWVTLGQAKTISRPSDDVWRAFAETKLVETRSLVTEGGGSLVLVLSPRMDQPFEETVESGYPGYDWVRRWAEGAGLPVVDLAQEWVGLDPEEVRLDLCCHMNSRGHTLLSELLQPILETELQQQ